MDKILLFILLGIGVISDYKSNQISNWLCLSGGVLGLLLIWNRKGIDGIEDITAGLVITLGILLPFWLLRIIGGGDVKMMMMASCFLGIHVLELLAISGICSAIYGAFLLEKRRNFRKRMMLLMTYCRECVLQGTIYHYPFDKDSREDREDGGIHISYAIFVGYVIGTITGVLPGI